MFIIDAIMAFTGFIWGWPMLIVTFAIALLLSIKLKFFQFTHFAHCMKKHLWHHLR